MVGAQRQYQIVDFLLLPAMALAAFLIGALQPIKKAMASSMIFCTRSHMSRSSFWAASEKGRPLSKFSEYSRISFLHGRRPVPDR